MERREQMRTWLARREARGLTFRELSLEAGVPVGTLAFWAWKLRRESRDDEPAPAFVELVAKEPESGGKLEIVLANGRRVLVSEGLDEDQLVRVVRALERC
jgi:hypothetical protein